jgi:hypothetical protein
MTYRVSDITGCEIIFLERIGRKAWKITIRLMK